MDLVGHRIGNYVAVRKLGEGGMGAVYLCEHPLLKRRVAAKVLHDELASSPDLVARMFAEAKAANEIHSEHVIEVLDYGSVAVGGREQVYLLMELLEGESLGQRLFRVGLTLEESLHVVAQCCEALAVSHAAGIVHRDLKPDNVFLVSRGGDRDFVKILDFGIAKFVDSAVTRTQAGVVLGTPAYMSPEQCSGGRIDHRSDVYSLGIVLYELCTGRVPFNAKGYGEVLLMHLTATPPPPRALNPAVPEVLERAILRAIEKDPTRRFQSMTELREALLAVGAALAAGSGAGGGATRRTGEHPRASLRLPREAPRRIEPLGGAGADGPSAEPGAVAAPERAVGPDAPTVLAAPASEGPVVAAAPPDAATLIAGGAAPAGPVALPHDRSGHVITGPEGQPVPASVHQALTASLGSQARVRSEALHEATTELRAAAAPTCIGQAAPVAPEGPAARGPVAPTAIARAARPRVRRAALAPALAASLVAAALVLVLWLFAR